MPNKTVSMDTNNHPELTLHIDALPDPATITTPSRNVNVVAGETASTLQQIVLLRYILEIVFCMGDDKIPTVEFRGFSNHEIHQIFSQILYLLRQLLYLHIVVKLSAQILMYPMT